ncbi:hypothetical protein MAP00_007846 [Monascus purpureus]|nr:hypothetical protein MAP00_007846 [Monascus purpureus]
MAPSVLALMYIMSPVAWPVAKLLDKLLGEDHGTIYKKAGLKTLVTLHKTLGEAGEQLNSDEVTIISAVLDLKEKSVGSIMTPMDDVFTMSADTVLDEPTMDLILSAGYSRIPIHAPDNPRNFLGMLLVKMLITYDPEDCRRVREFALATLPETRPETSCLDIVNFFQEGKAHMVLVSDYPGEDRGALGVVTLEDVIEELIGEEIIDESDVFIDVHKAIRRMTPAPKARVPKGRVVEEPPAVHFEGEHPEPQSEATERTSGELRRSSIETPLPRFQMRIPNYQKDPDSPDRWVTHIGATDEIREHLKHLGPSNLASRPRQTRYQNVKIKRGRDSPTPSGPSDTSASVTAPLLQSADVDGIASTDYGAVSASKATTASSPKPKHIPQIAIPEAVDEEDDSYQQPQPSHGRTASRFIESSCAKPTSRPLYIHDGPARSGSITEHVVDINGVRKMVLHTTSTSSSETDRPSSRPSTDHSHGHKDGSIAGSEADTPKDPNSILRLQKKRRKRRKRTANSTSNSGKDEERPLLEH